MKAIADSNLRVFFEIALTLGSYGVHTNYEIQV